MSEIVRDWVTVKEELHTLKSIFLAGMCNLHLTYADCRSLFFYIENRDINKKRKRWKTPFFLQLDIWTRIFFSHSPVSTFLDNFDQLVFLETIGSDLNSFNFWWSNPFNSEGERHPANDSQRAIDSKRPTANDSQDEISVLIKKSIYMGSTDSERQPGWNFCTNKKNQSTWGRPPASDSHDENVDF